MIVRGQAWWYYVTKSKYPNQTTARSSLILMQRCCIQTAISWAGKGSVCFMPLDAYCTLYRCLLSGRMKVQEWGKILEIWLTEDQWRMAHFLYSQINRTRWISLKLPQCEIFGLKDSRNFSIMKPLWEGNFGAVIKNYKLFRFLMISKFFPANILG